MAAVINAHNRNRQNPRELVSLVRDNDIVCARFLVEVVVSAGCLFLASGMARAFTDESFVLCLSRIFAAGDLVLVGIVLLASEAIEIFRGPITRRLFWLFIVAGVILLLLTFGVGFLKSLSLDLFSTSGNPSDRELQGLAVASIFAGAFLIAFAFVLKLLFIRRRMPHADS